jgi:hypothetical protein
MIEPARCDRFALEPRGGFFVAAEIGVQNLDRDRAADAGVLAFVDAAHPAFAEHGVDAVAPVEHAPEWNDARIVR